MDVQDTNITKHEQLLKYMENLQPGTKISVRKLAKEMGVSEGTAYRAVKEGENMGIVMTKERIGTIRIEKKRRDTTEQLTFAEVVRILDANVLGGKKGLEKTLHKLVVGAMKLDAMCNYIDANNLLIVGNRDEAHRLALQRGAGVLITGGFDTNHEVKLLADQLNLPLISSKHDTYTVSAMIHRALFDHLIKKKVVNVEDIFIQREVLVLHPTHTVRNFQQLVQQTGHSRFPVVDEWHRLIGIITYKDIYDVKLETTIDKLCMRNPLTASLQTSLASVAHMMVRESIKLLPIIDSNRKLLAVVTRRQVLQTLRAVRKQPQNGETFADLIWQNFILERNVQGKLSFRGMITPQMVNNLGSASEGIVMILMTQAALRAANDMSGCDHMTENMTLYFMRPLQIEDMITLQPEFIELSRKCCKLEITVQHGEHLVAKAMMTVRAID